MAITRISFVKIATGEYLRAEPIDSPSVCMLAFSKVVICACLAKGGQGSAFVRIIRLVF